MESQKNLLVAGASGQLGQRVLDLLLERNAGSIIATTRVPEKLDRMTERGVAVRRADYDDPVSLEAAFAGVDRLLLISTDAIPGRRMEQQLRAVEAARSVGVKHVFYTSVVNQTPDAPMPIATDHYATEQALVNSGMGYTLLRENLFAEVPLLALKDAVRSGKLVNAVGEGRAAYVTREDIALVAAAVMVDGFEGGRALDVTGPDAVSQDELAALVSEISGRTVTYEPVDLSVAVANFEAKGMPRFLAEAFASFDTGIAQGLFADVSDTVERLSGTKPTSMRDFLIAHRDELLEAVSG